MVRKITLDPTVVERLAKNYADVEAARLLSISTQTFYLARKKYKISSYAERNETYKKRCERVAIDPEEIEKLATEYTDKEAAEILGISLITYNRRRREFGIPSYKDRTGLRKGADGEISKSAGLRKHHFNERFFQDINTPLKAYLLGFFVADGNVKKDLYTARLSVHPDDIEIIEILKKALNHPGNIVEINLEPNSFNKYRGQKLVHFDICSKQLCKDLVSWGVTPKKTFTVTLTKPLPSDLFKHYLLGIIDGDGCISETEVIISTASVDLAKIICINLFNIFGEKIRVREKTTTTGKIQYELSIRKNLNCKIIEWLYAEPYQGLSRKQEKARKNLLSI